MHPIYHRKSQQLVPINEEYLAVFRSYHKKVPFRMLSVRTASERLRRCLKIRMVGLFLQFLSFLCAKLRSPNGSHGHLHPSSHYCGKYLSFFGAFQWFPKAKKPRSHLRFWWLLLSYSDKQKERWEEQNRSSKRESNLIDVGNSESSKAHQFYTSCRVSSRFVASPLVRPITARKK